MDTAFIGHIGTAALGGIGIGSSLFLLLVWVLTQTKTAISAIVSRHYGAGQLAAVRGLIPQALLFVIALGFLVSWSTRAFSEPLLELYAARGEVLEQANVYFRIRALGFPLILATFLFFGIFRGVQNTAWAMGISISAAVINLLLDVLLVFGVEGWIPAMGVAGAAWASFIAQCFMLLGAIFIYFRKTDLGLHWSRKLHVEFKNLVGLSSGFFIRTIALNITFFLANRYATSYGEEYIAAHTIALNIWLFSSYFIDGYANAGNALAGRLLGKGDTANLYKVALRLMRISIGIGALLSIFYLLLYPWMPEFFSDDPLVWAQFYTVYWILILAQPLNAIAFSLDGIFKGLGRARYLMNTLILASLLGFFPILLLLDYFELGLPAIWYGFVAFMLFRGLSLLYELRKAYR